MPWDKHPRWVMQPAANSLRGPQHNFLLSPAAKALKPAEAKRLSRDEAYERFKDVRWGWTGAKAVCTWCGHERVYEYNTRLTFRCAKCGRQFSVTSATPFSSRKMSFGELLGAISMRINYGYRAIDIGRELGVNYRTAWLFSKNLRVIGGNIIPTTRERAWPYQPEGVSDTPEVALMKKVASAVNGLPEQVRADVAQDMILGVLSGEISEDDLMRQTRKYIRLYHRGYDNRFNVLSLDQPVPGTDFLRWDEIIADDREHF